MSCGVVVRFKVIWLCDLTIRPPLLLPSLAPADSGNPCRNDGVGVGRLHHLKFSHYPLWKYMKAGSLEVETTLERYEEATDLIDDFIPDRELATETLTEAVRYGHPIYDLLYAVLARRTGCTLLSMDQRLKTLLDRIGIGTI